MGNEKTTTKSEGQQRATATPEERELLAMQLERQRVNQPMQQQLDNNQYSLANTLLTGGSLPGNLQGAGGVSPFQTQEMVNASMRDIMPQFQSAGILDSGAAIQGGINASANVRNQNAQFNVQALQQLLNQAMGGSSQLTGMNNQSNSILGGQLAGLRTINTNGRSTVTGMNPFLKSFQQSAGKTLGSPKFQAGPFSMGGE